MEQELENTDGRQMGVWKSRYEKEAERQIICEAIYLGLLLFLAPLAIFLVWIGIYQFGLTESRYLVFSRYFYGWAGGTLGGTMFSIKWLYHAVARCYWNVDRRLWRILTPHLSGGLSFAFLTVASSGLFTSINPLSLQKPPAIIACSFLVGYFSDSAIGKLREVAETLFGKGQLSNSKDTKTTK